MRNRKQQQSEWTISLWILAVIIFTVLLIATLKADPVCEVRPVNGSYIGIIKSMENRVPDSNFTVAIPAKLPIIKDSYFGSCIIHRDHTPLQEQEVVVSGDDWNVTEKTSVAGCFSMTIPSDINFTMKAWNPKTKEWAKLGGIIKSANKGKLLTNAETIVIPYDNDLINVSQISAEDGVKVTYPKGSNFRAVADLKKTKHSVVVEVPTVAGKKYTVRFKVDKPMWVWFSDGVRGNHNPAKLNGGGDKIIKLDSFTAKKKTTRLYFQAQKSEPTTVKDLSIKLAE